jgi:quinolinate synthase
MMDQSALNDREVERHPESGDSVPEEATYALSIRMMINPLDISGRANIITIPNELPESLPNKLPESRLKGLPSCLKSCRPRSRLESHQSFLLKGHF